MTQHTWENIDSGTVGWHRCSVCGLRSHFPNNEIKDDGEDCEERLSGVVETLADKVTTLLHNHDADTDTIRQMLAKAITAQKADSPYTRLAK